MGHNQKNIFIFNFFLLFSFILIPEIALSGNNENLSSILLNLSKQTNKNLPVKLDNEITLETTYVSDNTFVWKYRFSKDSNINNPNFNPKQYKYYAIRSQKEIACNDSSSMEILRSGGSFYYLFTDIYGKTIVDFTINSTSCRN